MMRKSSSRLGVDIPAIGQGTMGVGGYLDADYKDDRAFVESLRLGMDLGMLLIDTAEVYGGGHSEQIVGQAIRGRRSEVFLATKVSPENLAERYVVRACEGSLKRLGTDYIDLYQAHWPNPGIPIGETMAAMRRLREEGKVRFVGVSNFSPGQIQEAMAAFAGEGFVSTQEEYNLFDRTVEDGILPYCIDHDLLLFAYSPLDQGAVACGSAASDVLSHCARKYGKSPAQLALGWLVQQSSVVAIPKAVKPEHVRQNAEAVFDLDQEDGKRIDEAFARHSLSIPVDRVKVVPDGVGNRNAYQTVHQALENALGFTPSPRQLAEDILRRGEPIKPVRVRRSTDASGRYDYDLVEGRVRYWAWVIAHEGKQPIPVLVRT